MNVACPYGCPWTLRGLELDDQETEEALAAHVSAHLGQHRNVQPEPEAAPADPSGWSKSRIVDSFHRWQALHGRAPAYSEWDPRVEGFPSASMVRHVFGSWAAAQHAAGIVPRKPGRPRKAVVAS